MEQFSLDKYLENPSRKVVTRRGNPVRIICTDRKHGEDDLPIVFLEETNDGEFLLSCKSNGMHDNYKDYQTQYDLFFADNDELTEFQNKLFSVMSEVWQNYLLSREIDIAETVKEYSGELLDLARKELQPEFDKELEKAYKTQDDVVYRNWYTQGKQDALKAALESLPKWKKSTEKKDFDRYVLLFEDEDRVVLVTELYKNEYYIELEDLKTLPKEE